MEAGAGTRAAVTASVTAPVVLELEEHRPSRFPRRQIPDAAGRQLHRVYGRYVHVEFPSPKTKGCWELTPRGWVGHIPLTRELHLSLQPKVPLRNVFAMWEYAYRLRSFRFLDGLVGCGSLEEFYERLAAVFAERVLERVRKGLYRTYVPERERLAVVRGRLDVPAMLRRPWDARLECLFEEHTPDVPENQILGWTLERIMRSGRCGERVLPIVRRAHRALHGHVRPVAFRAKDCVDRRYDRLSLDYKPLHALARFFLERHGPTHEAGAAPMVPFLVNMPRLYELFVAEWLRANLPVTVRLETKQTYYIGMSGEMRFEVDLQLVDTASGALRCVADTKYKRRATPATADIQQVLAYGVAKRCGETALVYPLRLRSPLDAVVGGIRVRSLTFDLEGDLEGAGQQLLDELLS
jgi:5-methylcytosine-specific restriction enzyme subunit McrC